MFLMFEEYDKDLPWSFKTLDVYAGRQKWKHTQWSVTKLNIYAQTR